MLVLLLSACWITSTSELSPTPLGTPNRSIAPISTNAPGSSLRFDGLYQSVQLDNSWMYLRFYADGTVLSVGSTGDYEKVAQWFNKSLENRFEGQYQVRGSMLEFSVTGKEGTVDYAGTIDGEELVLNVNSHINGYQATNIYHFVEILNMQP